MQEKNILVPMNFPLIYSAETHMRINLFSFPEGMTAFLS